MKNDIILSNEQQLFIDKALTGKNILVDACIGSGKTTAIQKLCCELPSNSNILYLTYNRLLKLDAKSKIKSKNVLVTNYDGFAWKILNDNNIHSGVGDLVYNFNQNKCPIDKFDILIIDEYQDIEQEHADMLEYIKSFNSNMQIIAVGDIDQKIYDKTSLDVIEFIDEFLGEYEKIQFTNCFRLSSDLAGMLGRVWGKTINGVNPNCIVEQMNIDEVVSFLSYQKTSDILCLGSRNGSLSDVLNELENNYPDKFNKNTVYASIRDQDSNAAKPKKTSAIFTTYDSSKGMERKICVIFDFTESYWQYRVKSPKQSYEILRNIFCVAASRGKERIIFVTTQEAMLSEKTLSEKVEKNDAIKMVNISDMFDFKYKEDVEKCFSLLSINKLDYGDSTEIKTKNNDGLIDLSPCIGKYRDSVFFKNYNIDKDIELLKMLSTKRDKSVYDNIKKETSIEKKILFLISEETNQKRYITQVDLPFITEDSRKQLSDRLETKFQPNENVQVLCRIPFADINGNELFPAIGIADVVKDNIVYELKFVSEVQHTHFLQCACYMIALNLNEGVLWNIKNNVAYSIKIPDKNAFLDAVAKAITKGDLKQYNAPTSNSQNIQKFAVIDTETNMKNEVMSLGVVIANSQNFQPIESKYYIINPEYKIGGIYSNALKIKGKKADMTDTRQKVLTDVQKLFHKHSIYSIFAYNASFDYKHLPELSDYTWYDIMNLSAYKKYNSKITDDMECYGTGRLKRNANVEDMFRLLSGDRSYYETHNAFFDALDELKIMEYLDQKFENYSVAIYKPKNPTETSTVRNKQTLSKKESEHKLHNTRKPDIPSYVYHINDKIQHKIYGIGTVASIYPNKNFDYLEIVFENYGSKIILSNSALLTIYENIENPQEITTQNTTENMDNIHSPNTQSNNISRIKKILKNLFKSKDK